MPYSSTHGTCSLCPVDDPRQRCGSRPAGSTLCCQTDFQAPGLNGVLMAVLYLQIIERYLAAGAAIVSLRMGAEGSLVARQSTQELVYVPAADAPGLVDVTGCGNAFCGAFLVALQQSPGDLRGAAAWGSAAASCMAEAEGTIPGCSVLFTVLVAVHCLACASCCVLP
jgi:hypothetical protein